MNFIQLSGGEFEMGPDEGDQRGSVQYLSHFRFEVLHKTLFLRRAASGLWPARMGHITRRS